MLVVAGQVLRQGGRIGVHGGAGRTGSVRCLAGRHAREAWLDGTGRTEMRGLVGVAYTSLRVPRMCRAPGIFTGHASDSRAAASCRRAVRVRPAGAHAHVAEHEVVERAAEQIADHEQLVHFGVGLLGFPFRNGLPRDAEQHGQSLLGYVALGAQVLQVGAEAHRQIPSQVIPSCHVRPMTPLWHAVHAIRHHLTVAIADHAPQPCATTGCIGGIPPF